MPYTAGQYNQMTFEQKVADVSGQLISTLRDQVASILYYPHPFPKVNYPHPFAYCGFVVVFRDDANPIVTLIAAAHNCVPPDTSLHCLRHCELFELSLPVFWFLNVVDRQMHLPYLLKYKGKVLYGHDLRDEVCLPANPRLLFHNKLEVCAHFLRSGLILDLLMRGEYLLLLGRLERQMKYLMASALLVHGEWDVTLDELPAQFKRRYTDAELTRIWREFSSLSEKSAAEEEQAHRQTAFEAVWLFESFLRRLWDEAGKVPACL